MPVSPSEEDGNALREETAGPQDHAPPALAPGSYVPYGGGEYHDVLIKTRRAT